MSVDQRTPMIRNLMLPKDTNALGHIFGGVILSNIDLAASIHARQVSPKKYVTKVMREVEFIAPVKVGDVVSYYTSSIKQGNTSVTIGVSVEASRGIGHTESIKVTEAEVVMVAVNDDGKPIPINS